MVKKHNLKLGCYDREIKTEVLSVFEKTCPLGLPLWGAADAPAETLPYPAFTPSASSCGMFPA